MKMTKIIILLLFAFGLIATAFQHVSASNDGEPWTKQQLLEPTDLAKTINNPKAVQPLIYCVGPQAIIKNSIEIGSAQVPSNLYNFKQQISRLPKNANIVIYCGCCPFDVCPNVRPAVNLLKEMKFTNFKLLNLPRNIKVDWIDHGYPVAE
jgi:thiosulfate/3-mercaptopyruvate sulfurtransferase